MPGERRACQCVRAHKAKDAEALVGWLPLEGVRQVMWEGELIKGTGWASTRQLPCLEVTWKDPCWQGGSWAAVGQETQRMEGLYLNIPKVRA